MRLGIRRKLIGTLMLVGLFPLAMSLIVILGGGAAMQLSRIRSSYEETASNCAQRIANTLLHDELRSLSLVALDPEVISYVSEQNKLRAAAGPTLKVNNSKLPAISPADAELDKQWPSFGDDNRLVYQTLHNRVSEKLRRLRQLDTHHREMLVSNIHGQLIAADHKTTDFFQGDEEWWRTAFDNGTGRVFISTVIKSPSGTPVIEMAIPIFDVPSDAKRNVIGILKLKVDADWVLEPLREQAIAPEPMKASTQLIDTTSDITVWAPPESESVDRAQKFFLRHEAEPHVRAMTLFFNDIIIGARPVPLAFKNPELYPALTAPTWVVVVAKPSEVAMAPVYKVATIVAAIGIALILVLFILGIAISNREIIMPILRLREATAAVGRGELNVRLLSDASDPTFRRDELGDLARDFDEMTRQLQKNVNQLARSNEAKRRFMELAGHELRTPVTYLIGVCQLAQRQLQALAAAATDGEPEDARTIALAAKSAGATQSALQKIAAKTQRLSRIIDNLLKLVTNDQFTTRMNKMAVDVRALLLQVTSDHRPFIAERKQQLVLDIAENLPSIEADKDKLEDALTNLISNAIRFSPDGTVIRVAAHEVVGDMLEILVEDSGPGIPQQDLANLFEPFYTGSDIMHHHSGTFEFGSKGIGLGLAIVRRFIELHGGVVRAHTLVRDPATSGGSPTGTQFQILLPLTKEQDFSPSTPSAPPEHPDTPEHSI